MAGASWRLLGSRDAADTLLEAISGDDEQTRMLAGMSLVKAGQKSFQLIVDKIDSGEATPAIVRLLPDIGGEGARPILEDLAARASGEVQQAASESLDLLDRIQEL